MKQRKTTHKKTLKKASPKPASKENSSLRDAVFSIRYVFWIILLPFISITYHNDSFEAFQNYRFLIHTVFLSIYGILFFLTNKKKRVLIKDKSTKLFFISSILFVIWSAFCSIFATNYFESLRPIAHLVIFILSVFFIMESLSQKGALVNCIKAFSIMILLSALVGLMQSGDIGFTNVPGSTTLPIGFSGNRNLFGGWLVAGICLPAFLMVTSKGTWKWFAVITCGITFVAIILSQTRTAWIAMIVILAVGVIGWVLIHGKNSIKQVLKPALITIVILGTSIGTTLFTSKELRDSVSYRIKSIVDLANASAKQDESLTADTSLRHRFMLWRNTVKIAKEHPFLGIGMGNWKLIIPLYGAPNDIVASGNQVMIKAHNMYLETLSETGVIGFLLYLSMFMIVLQRLYTLLRSKQDGQIKIVALFISLGFISLLVDSIASFSLSRIEHLLLFAFFIGTLLSLFEASVDDAKCLKMGNKELLSIILPVLLYALAIAYSNFQFGKSFKKADQAFHSKDNNLLLKYSQEGVSLLTKSDDIACPMELYMAMAYLGKNELDKALIMLDKAAQYAPNHAEIMNTYGAVYFTKGDCQTALKYLEKGIEITPLNMSILYNLAGCYYSLKDYESTIKAIEKGKLQSSSEFKAIYEYCLKQVKSKE